MADLPLSVKITRTELTLGDLELNDHTAYEIVRFGPPARRRRNSYETSGNAHGGELSNSVLDMLVHGLAVRVLGSGSSTTLETRTAALIAAVEQSSFQIKETKNSLLTTYEALTCEQISPASPDGTPISGFDPKQLIAFQHVYAIDVPCQPIPTTGPI